MPAMDAIKVVLRACDPALNRHRSWVVEAGLDLFGNWTARVLPASATGAVRSRANSRRKRRSGRLCGRGSGAAAQPCGVAAFSIAYLTPHRTAGHSLRVWDWTGRAAQQNAETLFPAEARWTVISCAEVQAFPTDLYVDRCACRARPRGARYLITPATVVDADDSGEGADDPKSRDLRRTSPLAANHAITLGRSDDLP